MYGGLKKREKMLWDDSFKCLASTCVLEDKNSCECTREGFKSFALKMYERRNFLHQK